MNKLAPTARRLSKLKVAAVTAQWVQQVIDCSSSLRCRFAHSLPQDYRRGAGQAGSQARNRAFRIVDRPFYYSVHKSSIGGKSYAKKQRSIFVFHHLGKGGTRCWKHNRLCCYMLRFVARFDKISVPLRRGNKCVEL